MGRKLALLLCMAAFVLGACSQGPFGHYQDDEMVGTVQRMDVENSQLDVDISEWHKRDLRGAIPDYGVMIPISVTEELAIVTESGDAAGLTSIKQGQKVRVEPPMDSENAEYVPQKVVLLDMTYEEKYGQLLSKRKGTYHTTVYATDGHRLSLEEESRLMELVPHTALSFGEYPRDYVVDFEEELGIERYPVMFVYDHESLVLLTYDMDELDVFFASK